MKPYQYKKLTALLLYQSEQGKIQFFDIRAKKYEVYEKWGHEWETSFSKSPAVLHMPSVKRLQEIGCYKLGTLHGLGEHLETTQRPNPMSSPSSFVKQLLNYNDDIDTYQNQIPHEKQCKWIDKALYDRLASHRQARKEHAFNRVRFDTLYMKCMHAAVRKRQRTLRMILPKRPKKEECKKYPSRNSKIIRSKSSLRYKTNLRSNNIQLRVLFQREKLILQNINKFEEWSIIRFTQDSDTKLIQYINELVKRGHLGDFFLREKYKTTKTC